MLPCFDPLKPFLIGQSAKPARAAADEPPCVRFKTLFGQKSTCLEDGV